MYFFSLLRSHRARLHLPAVRVQLGFLYEAYHGSLWYFEIVDMAHKLFLTSLVAFLPQDAALAVGVGVAGLYLGVLLVVSPYVRKGDDRLHLFVQCAILMILMCVQTFVGVPGLSPGEEYDSRSDTVMSVILLGMFALVAFAWCRARRASKLATKSAADGEDEVEDEAEGAGLQELALPKGAVMVRNPLWADAPAAAAAAAAAIELQEVKKAGGEGGDVAVALKPDNDEEPGADEETAVIAPHVEKASSSSSLVQLASGRRRPPHTAGGDDGDADNDNSEAEDEEDGEDEDAFAAKKMGSSRRVAKRRQ